MNEKRLPKIDWNKTIREILIQGFGGHNLPIGNINLAEAKIVAVIKHEHSAILKLVEEETEDYADNYESAQTVFYTGIIKALESQIAELKQIVIEDVPHRYQDRLLLKLTTKS